MPIWRKATLRLFVLTIMVAGIAALKPPAAGAFTCRLDCARVLRSCDLACQGDPSCDAACDADYNACIACCNTGC